MLTASRATTYAMCLLTGTLLTIVAALVHPNLAGDGAGELAAIAHADAWLAIHWAFLFGFVLSLTGLLGVVDRCAGTAGEAEARGGVMVGVFAYGAWMVVVTFMVGAGWTLAHNHVPAEGGATATQAVFVYDMIRPFALAAQRIGAFALGISTCLLGWGVLGARMKPRWLGWAGVASGVIAIALAVLFGEATKADQAAFVLPVLWQFVTAVVLLAERSRA